MWEWAWERQCLDRFGIFLLLVICWPASSAVHMQVFLAGYCSYVCFCAVGCGFVMRVWLWMSEWELQCLERFSFFLLACFCKSKSMKLPVLCARFLLLHSICRSLLSTVPYRRATVSRKMAMRGPGTSTAIPSTTFSPHRIATTGSGQREPFQGLFGMGKGHRR